MRILHFGALASVIALGFACSAAGQSRFTSGTGGSSTGGGGLGGGTDICGGCAGNVYTPCDGGKPGTPVTCPAMCAPAVGCVTCVPGSNVCVGNEVHACAADGMSAGPVVQVCDVSKNQTCSNGACADACAVAADQPSNVGCQFWAVQLDQQDALNNPVTAPWGVALANTGQGQANVTIEINTAPVGQAVQTQVVQQLSVNAGELKSVILPMRTLDCGAMPNDYAAPGTCLSSNAFRITSSAPIVVYQFNVYANSYSNDASLLLPTNALGKLYRVIGWPAGHPIPIAFPGLGTIIDRSYVTVVGTQANTSVTVKPSWRVKGNSPIAATPAGGSVTVTLGPFDVLNLETDDGTLQDDPKTIADLSGSVVEATAPVAVFSGVESTGAPGGVVDVPTPSGWMSGDSCCLDHLEDQILPMESVGTHYVIARSPIRSTDGFREPDILRFVGVAEAATVTTNLPAPFDSFTIQPGEVKTTWTQDNIVASSDKPVMIGQILVSNQYCGGTNIGDPSLTVFPTVEQFRSDYLILAPSGWDQSWIVISAPTGATTKIDGAPTTGCTVEPAGFVQGTAYESRRCEVQAGVHAITGDQPFGIVAYGYGAAGSYALAGGADVKHVYDPPPIK